MLRRLVLGTNTDTGMLESIPREGRYRHTYILGRTGVGKSSLLQRIILKDAERDYAVVVFDSGTLAISLWETIPEPIFTERFRFFSISHPIPYNPFLRTEKLRTENPSRLKNELVNLINEITIQDTKAQPLTPRMIILFGIALNGVLKKEKEPNFSHLYIYIKANADMIRRQMDLADPKDFNNTKDAVLNRLEQFVSDRRIRRVICNPHRLDFNKVLNEGKVLVISLRGLEPSMLKFLGTVLFQGLLSTITEPEEPDRKDCAIYIDEFQQYLASHLTDENFRSVFKYGRGFKAALTIAHQDFGGMNRELLNTIHTNAYTRICFTVGPDEAPKMSSIFGGKYRPDFVDDYHCFTRIYNDVFPMETRRPKKKIRNFNYNRPPYARPDPEDPTIRQFPTSRPTRRERPRFSTGQVAEQPASYGKMKGNAAKRVNIARNITAEKAGKKKNEPEKPSKA